MEKKKTKYSNPSFINDCMNKYNVLNVAVVPFIMGARGVWCQKNREVTDLLEMSRLQMNLITADTINGIISIRTDFGTRGWVNGNVLPRRNI